MNKAEQKAVTDSRNVASVAQYKTPKSAIVRNAIELSNLADKLSEQAERNRLGAATLTLDDIDAIVETLRAQLSEG